MKKFTITITRKNVSKTVKVAVDDQTAKILITLDEQTRNEYLKEEYIVFLSDKREKNHAVSLSSCMDKGMQFEDMSEQLSEEKAQKELRLKVLQEAMTHLKEKQKWLITELYVKNRSAVEVAKSLGVSQEAIRARTFLIYEKIRKYFKKNPNETA